MNKVDGWPLKVIDERTTTDEKGRATTTRTITEVEELRRQNISGDTFVIPADHQQTQMMPGMTPGMTDPEQEEEREEEGGRFRKLLRRDG